MSDSPRVNDTVSSQDPGYEWRYEYYDYEDPGSFEGLSVHRYSIVIVFWVGLAVFVIFMFFVLTLLAKTRAPHPDGRDAVVKRGEHLPGCTELNLHSLQRNVSFPAKPLLQESSSRSVLRCQVHEEVEDEEEEEAGEPGGSGATARSAACGGPGAGAANGELSVGLRSGGGAACDGPPGPAAPGTSAAATETPENFDIPNVVH